MPKRVVLLVEDDPGDASLIAHAFQRCGFAGRVDVVRDGAEALAYLFGSGPDLPALPALVLLDLKLPGVSGLEVLRRLRADERTHPLPVVILTASSEAADLEACYSLGANSFIRKPVNFDTLTRAVEQLCLYWLVLNRSALDSP